MPDASDPATAEAPAQDHDSPAATRVTIGGLADAVNLDTIVNRFPEPDVPRAKTYLEWSGTRQMSVLLGFICILALAFAGLWGLTRPTLEEVSRIIEAARETGDRTAVTTEAMTELLAQLQKRTPVSSEIFQLVVMTSLVPLFTLLAGYVFGRGQQEQRRREDADEDA